eukprot:240963_1
MESKQKEECVIYWDYENCPIPSNAKLSDVKDILINEIKWKLGYEAIIHQIRLYNNEGKRQNKLPKKIRNDMDKLNIHFPTLFSQKSEHVDKKIIGDIGIHLLDWKNVKKTVIVLISGDTDYASFLAAIKQKQFAKIILIPSLTFTSNQIHQSLLTTAHFIIEKFYKDNEFVFTKCTESQPSAIHIQHCKKYHFPIISFSEEKEEKKDEEKKQNNQKKKIKKKKKNQENSVKHQDDRPKDPNCPKKPLNVFFIYAKYVRPQIKKKFPKHNSAEIMKEIGNKWNTLSDDDKLLY